MEALKALGVDVKQDNNELRQAISDVEAGKDVQKVAQELAKTREAKKNATNCTVDARNGGGSRS